MEKIHYFRPLYLALALTISLFSTASTPNRYKTSASLPDSLLTEQHIRSIYYTLPDSALSLLDEAEARRLPHLPQFRIDMLRGTVYERQGMYHLKERYIRRALQSDSVQHTPLRKLQVLTQLATALDRLNKYEEGIRIMYPNRTLTNKVSMIILNLKIIHGNRFSSFFNEEFHNY